MGHTAGIVRDAPTSGQSKVGPRYVVATVSFGNLGRVLIHTNKWEGVKMKKMTEKQLRKLIYERVAPVVVESKKTDPEVLTFARNFLIQHCPHIGGVINRSNEDAEEEIKDWTERDLVEESRIWSEFAQDDYDDLAGGYRYRFIRAVARKFEKKKQIG
jgi:hypothetical protein